MKTIVLALFLIGAVLSSREQIDPNPRPEPKPSGCVVIVTSQGPIVVCR